jgi:serine/threonine-protein kinase
MLFSAGDTVGDYQILGVLGQGGMGAVYRVRNLLSYREEAMKVVLPGAGEEAQAAERFLREIRVQASLRHPHIAELRTAVRSGDQVLMILELIEGWSVSSKLKEGPLPLDVSFRIIDDILSALAYAHKQGVIHRDIKPANIMVTNNGITKLTDFGIARSAVEERITQTSMAVGSLPYMSPEQIRSDKVDERSDLYALGVTLYEMLTGRLPVQGANAYAVMHAHMTATPPTPAELVPGLARSISRAVMKALAKSADERYASAEAFQGALRDALFGADLPKTATVLRPTAERKKIEEAELARVEAQLASAIGPIAKSLVAKALRQHSSVTGLCTELAELIPDPAERAVFLRAFGMGSGTKPAVTSAAPSAAKSGARSTAPLSEEVLEKARSSSRRRSG